ncbi:plastocyanin/azurin family copper-binding protein [Gorillibacterium sp. sgz5001074]|uniref:plastocyanin/azurin family copper-binding protein n=1 Tax=Gorillibacterium sp. sgz5001074 TaxID=3446695 RepID=UPI003F679238
MKLKRSKTIPAGLLAVMMTVGAALPAGAAESSATGADVVSDADLALELNILKGEGNGLTAEYLAKSTTRLQAAILYLRLKGLEQEALAFQGRNNFADASGVWEGGQSVMAYLKANPHLGWQGIGGGVFDPDGGITTEQLAKVLLEALGYKQDVDFQYAQVLHKAAEAGVVHAMEGKALHNADVASFLVDSLEAKTKEGTGTLAEVLKLPAGKLDRLKYPRLEWGDKAGTGTFLTDENGMALYLFKKDLADLNSCQGTCLQNWPVFFSEKLKVPAQLSKSDFGVLVRADGTKQTTFRGWPLYYYVKDLHPGDTSGQAVNNVWYLVNGDTLSLEGSKPKEYSIDMSGFRFTAPELTIAAGSTVKFTNMDSARHNAVALDGSFRTALLSKGQSETVTFDKPGIYEYICEPHKSSMKGKIIVK